MARAKDIRPSSRNCAHCDGRHLDRDCTSTGTAHPALSPPRLQPQVGLPHPHLPLHPATSDPPPHPPRSPPPPSLRQMPWHLPRPTLSLTPIHQHSLPAASLSAVLIWPLPLRGPPRDRSANPRRDHSPTLRLPNIWAPPPEDSTVRRRSSWGASRRPPPPRAFIGILSHTTPPPRRHSPTFAIHGLQAAPNAPAGPPACRHVRIHPHLCPANPLPHIHDRPRHSPLQDSARLCYSRRCCRLLHATRDAQLRPGIIGPIPPPGFPSSVSSHASPPQTPHLSAAPSLQNPAPVPHSLAAGPRTPLRGPARRPRLALDRGGTQPPPFPLALRPPVAPCGRHRVRCSTFNRGHALLRPRLPRPRAPPSPSTSACPLPHRRRCPQPQHHVSP